MATPPDKLSPVHYQMCAMKAAGLKRQEIATITGYSEAQITNVLAHPEADAMVARLTTDLAMRVFDDTAQQIQAATKEAFTTVVNLMRNGETDRIKQLSAFDILDRGGFKPKEVHVNADIRLPAKEAEIITETLEHMGREIPYRAPMDDAVRVLTKGRPQENTKDNEEEAAA